MGNVDAANRILATAGPSIPASIRRDVHRAIVAWLDMLGPTPRGTAGIKYHDALRCALAVCLLLCNVSVDAELDINDLRRKTCRALRLMAHAIDAAAQRSTGGP
jgi:hypothetical protein